MRKLFRNRRAVSPVVSAVLMMLVVMIGMSLLFAFFVNYTADYQTGSGSAVLESMTIEDVWFTDSTHVQIWVYNVGKVDFKITAFYIDGQQASIDSSSDFAVSVGGHGKLIVEATSFFAEDNSYSFKIVTERGSAFQGRYVWQ